ncbi:cyclic di-GMP phosphodiesterase response regulator RpfG [Clostridium homopropionicum DSM 5847]|uniref:Cyclic di-GMP phosphodiesterase response regulator RpfG n=1 Tax=Clostridium homopropionicum DSM 5847 TaxID=1121318 RepID=A0A0L6ZBT4_9CLOT|nr:HD-GYP domain-containing protein [Clostridium homopropionicum]KOA20435.1 cyclic di-GMP phosphodiesterase response regulator RpfG [Clostridium homopropionicum DSM 5847]SFG34812.1 GAF domain-containing protein [Clostridium homopropionicum]
MEVSIYIFALAIIILFCIFGYLLYIKEAQLNKYKNLFEIGRKITSNIKLNKLMEEIITIAKNETQAEAGSLYIVDEEKQELWFQVALGEKGDLLKEIRLKMGEGVAGWVAKEGVTLNIRDVNKDSRLKKEIGKKINFNQKAMLTLPIKYKDKTIAVIQLINKKGGEVFTEKDEKFIEGMCSQIAIALENAQLFKRTKELFIDSIKALASAVDAKDPYTNGHSERVTEYSLLIAKEMGMDEEKIETLEYMGLLHDVGKIGIKDSILNKQAPLDNEEFVIMKTHPSIGSKILSTMKSLNIIIPGVKYHHEKFDGTGYCDGLKGEEIPLEARIIAVADTYDAMTTDRPYRKGLSHEIAMEEINKFSGKQFDPKIVEYFNRVMKKRLISNDEQ